MNKPILLVANKDKKIFDLPRYLACGMSGNNISILNTKDLIPLPPSSEIFAIPDRIPIGFDVNANKLCEIQHFNPLAAFIPPGYTHLFSTAYKETEKSNLLPLFSYTPVAWYKRKFYVPILRIDKRKVHDMRSIDIKKVINKIKLFKNNKNRLIHHLEKCALTYKCPNALNFFLGRYECPLPVSRACNSKCIGCLSFQPEHSCSSTQERIEFTPTPSEIAEVALIHTENTHNPVLSFGQGCEGEPLLETDIIAEAIKLIRKTTKKSTINMNTNGSLPNKIEYLCKAGLDSMRVSLNSVREEYYSKYYKPHGYTFKDVQKSIQIGKKYNKFISINYLVMPGFTDEAGEFKELVKFIKRTRIDMIQWRNLNYDPVRYFQRLGINRVKKLLGIESVITKLKKQFPRLKHGYFNLPRNIK